MGVSIDEESVSEFSKDLKNLRKKYRSIDSDLGIALKALKTNPEDSNLSVRIDNLGFKSTHAIYKLKKSC